MSDLNQIGIHFTGPFTEADCNEYFGLLNDLRPGCNNIVGAAQYDQALEFAKTAAQIYPGSRQIFRHFKSHDNSFPPEDTGRWREISPRDWWEKIGKRYVGTGLTILSDNESTMDDYGLYAAWQADVMTRAGDEGVGVAFGRFPTHHPAKGKEQHLDKMLIAAFKYPGLHVFSPNVYWSADNIDGFKYPYFVIEYAKRLGIPLDVAIGEYALLRDIRDAYNGWLRCNISGKVYGLDLTIKARVHLPGIPVSVYAHKKWPLGHDANGQDQDTFGLDRDVLDSIRLHLIPLKAVPYEPPPPPPPTIPPKGNIVIMIEDPRWKPYSVQAKSAGGSNVREQPNKTAAAVATIKAGPAVAVSSIARELLHSQETLDSFDGQYAWHVIMIGGATPIIGWVREDVVILTPTPEPEQPPTLPPDAERMKWLIEQLTMMEYHNEQAFGISVNIRSMLEVVTPQQAQKAVKTGIVSAISQFVRKF